MVGKATGCSGARIWFGRICLVFLREGGGGDMFETHRLCKGQGSGGVKQSDGRATLTLHQGCNSEG